MALMHYHHDSLKMVLLFLIPIAFQTPFECDGSLKSDSYFLLTVLLINYCSGRADCRIFEMLNNNDVDMTSRAESRLYQYPMSTLPDIVIENADASYQSDDDISINDNSSEIPAWHSLSAVEINNHMRQAKAYVNLLKMEPHVNKVNLSTTIINILGLLMSSLIG